MDTNFEFLKNLCNDGNHHSDLYEKMDIHNLKEEKGDLSKIYLVVAQES